MYCGLLAADVAGAFISIASVLEQLLSIMT